MHLSEHIIVNVIYYNIKTLAVFTLLVYTCIYMYSVHVSFIMQVEKSAKNTLLGMFDYFGFTDKL